MGNSFGNDELVSQVETPSQKGLFRKRSLHARIFVRGVVVATALCVASGSFIQGMQVSDPVARHGKQTHSRRVNRQLRSVRKKTPLPPPVPADTAAQAATISLKDNQLTIEANNSDLSRILRRVAEISGMSIDGLTKSTRMFGVYGPGNPSDVLAALLAGSGYNFTMSGRTPDGTPSQLLLTAKSDNNAPSVPSNPTSTAPPPNALAPPAHATENTQDSQNRENRMQQYMQRLQTMHEQQEQQHSPQ